MSAAMRFYPNDVTSIALHSAKPAHRKSDRKITTNFSFSQVLPAFSCYFLSFSAQFPAFGTKEMVFNDPVMVCMETPTMQTLI